MKKEITDKNWKKIDGIYSKENFEPTYDIYDKKGKKLDGKYIKCKLGQDKLTVMIKIERIRLIIQKNRK